MGKETIEVSREVVNQSVRDMERGIENLLAPEWVCLGENVLVRRIDVDDEKTPGGIVKPEIAKQKSNRGIIVAVGEGRFIGNQFVPFGDSLLAGDEVRFTKYGGTEVPMDDGETLLLLHWKQIFLKKRA